MRQRALRACGAAGLWLVAATACNEQQFTPGVEEDLTAPAITIAKTAGDTNTVQQGLSFTVEATDNLALKNVSVSLTGGVTDQIDSIFNSQVQSLTLPVLISFPANTTAGGNVFINATAIDGNGNSATAAPDSIFLKNDDALQVIVLSPSANAVTSAGRSLLLQISARQRNGVRRVGWTATGAVTNADSIDVSPLLDSLVFVDTLAVPATATTGTFTITGFAVDSAGRRATSSPVTVTIQSAANDQTPPVVTFKINERVEIDDSITVTATDPSGIAEIGWQIEDLARTTVLATESFTDAAATFTELTRSWQLNLDPSLAGQLVIVTAFAVDGAGNRGTSETQTSPSAPAGAPAGAAAAAAAAGLDTITIVQGITKTIPGGGRVVDAIYSRNRDEVYFTNIDRDRIEIFRLVDTTFAAPVPVGSRPLGIALWPRDTLGAHADTVIVANSGGTNISIVDVNIPRQVRRHNLPNFLLQSVQTKIDGNTGAIKLDIVEYDLADRPQFVAAVCRTVSGGTTCHADSIYAVYSTTGTPAQPTPFPERGSLRWENLTAPTPQSHFFWEHAGASVNDATDTLQVIVDRGVGTSPDTVLSAACGQVVSVIELGFADTTFVRNSGNFTHALLGEGGTGVPAVLSGFARAIGYGIGPAISTRTCSAEIPLGSGNFFTGREELDNGITPSIRVRDFIANTAIPVRSIGINFNGLTQLIRADSIYVLDENLRLMGLAQVSGENPGMDLNFDHAFDARSAGTPTFGGTGDPNNRLLFAASPDPVIEVFDTFFFGKVATIPVRDPIVGPLRVSSRGANQLIVGVTATGIVTIEVPAITNLFPVSAP